MGELLDDLRAILDPGDVLEGEAVRQRSAGWGMQEPCAARAIVRPTDTAQLSAVMRRCFEARQPICVQGGMTGLVRGGVAGPEEIVVSLERMNRIEEIDPVGRTMTVQSGVPLQQIQQAADEAGLLFPLDLGARGSCQIGGNVATNAGGNRVIRYGMTRRLVLGLEAVLADGTVIPAMTRMLKDNAGFDLKQLFIGSEGTLGIVTRLVLRLERRPNSHDVALVSVDSFDHVTSLLRAMEERLGPTLSAFEVMWSGFYELVTTPPARSQPPLPHGSAFYVLVESLGSRADLDRQAFEEALGDALDQGWVSDAVLGSTSAERDRLWEMRDDIEQLGRLGPIFTYDIGLAIPTMPTYLEQVEAGLRERFDDPRWVVFGHLGDGNLHLVISVGDGSREARRAVEEVVYRPLEAIGGSVSAEHGIGFEKRSWLPLTRSEAEIELMRRLKSALDPEGILNPGRVIPGP